MFKRGRIQDPKAIRALTSPVRQEVIDTVESLGGSATIRELAAELGRPADGLYYHVEILRRAGLLAVENGRSRAGRDERRYRIPVHEGERLHLVYTPANRRPIRGIAAGMLRIARRDFDRAIQRDGVRMSGPTRQLWSSRTTGWVTAAELREINAHLERLGELLHRPRARGRDQLISLVWVMAPLEARPVRRGR
jgi:predicted ArsR family transcriptional regulator